MPVVFLFDKKLATFILLPPGIKNDTNNMWTTLNKKFEPITLNFIKSLLKSFFFGLEQNTASTCK